MNKFKKTLSEFFYGFWLCTVIAFKACFGAKKIKEEKIFNRFLDRDTAKSYFAWAAITVFIYVPVIISAAGYGIYLIHITATSICS